MKNRWVRILGGTILLLILAVTTILVYDNNLHKQEELRLPSHISSYWNAGYYKIDPETILESLEREDPNIFMPLLEDPQEIVQEVTDISISWTQADFLKIAGALSQFVWGDSMDLKDWNVYYIVFEGSCGNPVGFNYSKIAYFKTGRKRYTTRLVEIHPYFGWIAWGNGESYPKPILHKWEDVDLLGAKITADDALRIASEDAKGRLLVTEKCGVLMSSPQSNDSKNWHLKIFPGSLDYISYIVNLETGDYTIPITNK